MADPQYPDVPVTDGVPAVFRSDANPVDASNASAATQPMTNDSGELSAQTAVTWGIFDTNGQLWLDVDSIVAVEPGREARQSDYPTEEGGFQTFNKVVMPGETHVTVTKGGNDTERGAFLNALDEMLAGLTLYSFVMPDQTFSNRSLTHYTYQRTHERGVTLLTVELTLVEVRQDASSAFTDSKQPDGDDAGQGGPVQATTPTTAQTPAPEPIDSEAQPALADLGSVTPDMTQAQRASLTSSLIENGASIGQLVTAGVTFQSIPVIASAAQSLTTYVGGQSVKVNMATRAGSLFADVYVNDALIIGGVLAQNDNPLVRSAYLGFAGDLYFHADQDGIADIDYSDLGGAVSLLYAGA